MLPNSNIKLLVVILVIVVIGTIGSSYFLLQQNQFQTSLPESSSQRPFPKEEIASKLAFTNLSVLYQDDADTSGRTVIYSSAFNQPNVFSGNGLVYTTIPTKRLSYAVGLVRGWEDIPSSTDKYIILEEPETRKPLTKARVIFDKETISSETKPGTGLVLEDLSLVNQKKSGFMIIKPIANYDPSIITKLITKGDAVVVKPRYTNPSETSYIIDTNKVMLAQWLVIRRSYGKEALANELKDFNITL